MQVKVDQEKCISCGYCVNHCNEVFDWNANQKAEEEMAIIPKDYEEAVIDVVENCPTRAISEISDLRKPFDVDTTRDQDPEWILD